MSDLAKLIERRPLPDPAELRGLFTYYEADGKLFWRRRDADLFKSERDASAWNARYADREALTTIVKGYRYGMIFGRGVYAHRVVVAMHTGKWPEVCDHINGDKQDNRLQNLRSVRFVENMHNLPIPVTNKSGIMGVRYSEKKRKWVASIKADDAQIFLGHYETEGEARIARRAAEKALQFHANHGRKPLRALAAQNPGEVAFSRPVADAVKREDG